MNKTKYFTPLMISKIAIFAALSFGLYMFPKVPLPFFPSFLELNLSDVPALICGFLCGPLAAAITVFIKILLKLPFSATAYIGELTDLIIGTVFAVIPALIYKRKRTMLFAFWGLLAGTFASVIAAILSNIFISIPLYVQVLFEGNFQIILDWCSPFVSGMTRENFYLLYSIFIVLPFNLIRCAVAGIITFLLYKRISKIMHKFKWK